MRKETKLLKDYLQNIYPNNKFRISYIKTQNYIGSSDKIRILTDLPYKMLNKKLLQIVKGIAIYKNGEVITVSGNINSQMFGEETDVEFIEIDDDWNFG